MALSSLNLQPRRKDLRAAKVSYTSKDPRDWKHRNRL